MFMKETQMMIPHLFRCPISLDLLKDPVTLSTGQTYERSSIEKWLSAGNLICPVTMQKLHDPSFVPNHTLRHLINQWLQKGCNQTDPNYFTSINSLSALKTQLESHSLTLNQKVQALEMIQTISGNSPSGYSCLVQLGFLTLLLELAFGKAEAKIVLSQEYLEFVERTTSCVVKMLPFGQLGSLNMLKEAPKPSFFILLFKQGTDMIKINLCHIVEAISSSLDTKEICFVLGNSLELLRETVLLLHRNSEAASNAGTRAIFSLCNSEYSNIEKNLVKEGAVNGLVSYISNSGKRAKGFEPKAMAALEKLLLGVDNGAKEELMKIPKGLSALVKMIFKVSSDHESSESAVNLVMNVCSGSIEAREEAIKEGVLTQLLLLLQSQCSGRIKTKARMLLKLLRSKWVEDMKMVNRPCHSGRASFMFENNPPG